MSNLYFLVGLPGAGKSTYAKQLSKENNCEIFSSDKIRAEIGADGGDATKHSVVFNILHERIIASLKENKNCIYDATNISYKNRVNFIQLLNSRIENVNKICVIIATPYELCCTFNQYRKENVPKAVIDRMYRSWNTPYYSEGWDQIIIYYSYDFYRGCNGNPIDVIKHYYYWDQNNPHHSDGLGEHMWKTREHLIKNGIEDNNLLTASLIHDIGKLMTRVTDENGVSHYYDHPNVGAYEGLFFDYDMISKDCDPISISFLINHHMDPFSWRDNWNKATEKFKKKFGDKELKRILCLYHADITR